MLAKLASSTKGKGLIFLLHGPPGSTESISEYTQRPLYNIRCCDLGSPPPAVEKTLRSSLHEADVFIEERSTNELARNELVSVLLQALEYLEEIMFLTTNRIESLDPAFKSRIHLSIAYPPFSTGSRLQLWKTFISHRSPKGARYKWLDEKFLKRISREEVNRRQIKNVVSRAYTRANNGKRSLAANDIILG
ncbi:uncharacterized protein K444DRAFT_640922 [Hyaloscypha bicolor E]|uniref:ATPase AAA-type core domain-containing protein n=1 Tax=Hyaloscypha bicolor E TaxID=1095630 RepID=A0A2J6TN48_9HELO|nr:uncharacterized protein K444DRAFT_640922 [Hyaloscypha bicolor E]PMD64429.1 hypothetical protein K444DRAFT_640922 [Hyaloscypha bicolor E]